MLALGTHLWWSVYWWRPSVRPLPCGCWASSRTEGSPSAGIALTVVWLPRSSGWIGWTRPLATPLQRLEPFRLLRPVRPTPQHFSSMATVTGPTTGTGEMAPATSATSVVSTSPTTWVAIGPLMRLIPTSITVAPGLIQSGVTNPETPAAEITTSHVRSQLGQIFGEPVGTEHGGFRSHQQQRNRFSHDVGLANHEAPHATQIHAAAFQHVANRGSGTRHERRQKLRCRCWQD